MNLEKCFTCMPYNGNDKYYLTFSKTFIPYCAASSQHLMVQLMNIQTYMHIFPKFDMRILLCIL